MPYAIHIEFNTTLMRQDGLMLDDALEKVKAVLVQRRFTYLQHSSIFIGYHPLDNVMAVLAVQALGRECDWLPKYARSIKLWRMEEETEVIGLLNGAGSD